MSAPLVITEPGVYDIPDDQYHGDPIPGGSLSQTGAKRLLPPSCPAIFKYHRDNPGEERKEEFDFGKAAHQIVLGKGPAIKPIAADNWRTKAAQAAQADAYAAGEIPLLGWQVDRLNGMVKALRGHRLAAKLLDPDRGTAEQTLIWQDAQTGVWLRARLDYLPAGSARFVVGDYKTASSAYGEKFGKSAADYGYAMQDAHYRDGVKALGLSADPLFLFIVQEKTPPYLVNVINLDRDAKAIGAGLMRRAIEVYAECTASDNWPGYSDDIETVALPVWFTRQHEEFVQ